MNRKTFLKTLTTLGGVSCMIPYGWTKILDDSAAADTLLTVLHTNDMHSRIDPFSLNSKYPDQGGCARRAALIAQIRKENPNTLLLDAGDVFQGTPYFNYFGGEVEFKLMSQMGYDAMTLGNHDFDNGISGLVRQLPHARFSLLCANYQLKRTALAPYVQPYKIFNKKGIKVGVFGLGIALEGLVRPALYKGIRYEDPVVRAEQVVRILKQKQCQLIICLSHLGYDYPHEPGKVSDKILARQTQDIDLIIGGHTHTFLSKPEIVSNKTGQPVLINQVGWSGLRLGRIDFRFNAARLQKPRISTYNYAIQAQSEKITA